MSVTTINFTEPVLEEDLATVAPKAGQFGLFDTGIMVFGINTSDVTIEAGEAYVTKEGILSTVAEGIKVTTLAPCPAGAGIYGVAMGILPDASDVVAFTVA